MDMGATLCTKTSLAVIDANFVACKAYAQGKQHYYPAKKPRREIPVKKCYSC